MPGADDETAWESDYRRHVRDLTVSRLRLAGALAIALILLDGLTEQLFEPQLASRLLSSHLVAIAGILAILAASRLRLGIYGIFAASLLAALCIAGDIEAAIVATGNYHSPYQSGLGLLLVALGLLFPYDAVQAAAATAMVGAVYVTPTLLGVARGAAGEAFVINGFLLASAGAIAITGTAVTSRLRRREFFARKALGAEQARSERLLLNVLPAPIAERLKREEHPLVDRLDEVTVVFADIVGFTPLSTRLPPQQLVALLDELFSAFDRVVARHGLEKIKTIGDAYMAVAGVPIAMAGHAQAAAETALELLDEVEEFNHANVQALRVRIGMHSGPVVAGVIGRQKFIYDLWGDTVNTASRMESHGEPGRIQVSQSTHARLLGGYAFEPRGPIEIKGKGAMICHFLVGRRPGEARSANGRGPEAACGRD